MATTHFRHSYTRDRRGLLHRLRRLEGQARGIQRLVEEEAYCLDVLQQVEALMLLEDHIDGCLAHAVASGQGEPYVDEVMSVVRRLVGRRGLRTGAGGRAGGQHKGAPQGGTAALPD